MYQLRILTGFQLPNGEIDYIQLEFGEFQELSKFAIKAMDSGYEVMIRTISSDAQLEF